MKRQTIATTYGTELARWMATLDREAPCHLVVVEADDMGRGVALGAAPVVVGAATGCDLQPRDPRGSGRHVEVSRTEGGFRVKDLGRTSGVRYGGATVTEVELAAGATFVVGHTPLRIQPRRAGHRGGAVAPRGASGSWSARAWRCARCSRCWSWRRRRT